MGETIALKIWRYLLTIDKLDYLIKRIDILNQKTTYHYSEVRQVLTMLIKAYKTSSLV
jgi:hypothetical protein